MSETADPILSVEGLSTTIRTSGATVRALDDVSFSVPERGKVALVGESGSAKTMTALSLLRLVPQPVATIVGGTIRFKGRDLMSLSEREMRKVRGNEMAMVFQEPMTSLNPILSVGQQIDETLRAHKKLSRKQARSRTVELLDLVGIPSASTRVNAYPHQLSGGMRQRVMIAMALCCEPSLLIADEPTTALDVTIEAQILDLLERMRVEKGTATLLISHDLGVVAGFADHVVVIYAGQIVESAPVKTLFCDPVHPYTQALLQSLPPHPLADVERPKRLPVIEGHVPHLTSMPTGCRFQDRCPQVKDLCRKQTPTLTKLNTDHQVRCVHHGGEA